jgi:hypothetical protein
MPKWSPCKRQDFILLRMEGDEILLDRDEHFIDNLPRLMGILKVIADAA